MRFTIRTLALAALCAAGGVGIAAAQDPQDPGSRNVSFAGPGGVQLSGYLATPPGTGRMPAVLMVHEWWGLNRDTTQLADALAREGFVVLAADAFRGSTARTAADARQQVASNPAARIAADLDAALDFLKSHPRVDASRIASLGFCFGGTQSMLMGTRRADLSGVVIFYGGGPITDASRIGVMKEAGPVLGIYGRDDAGIPTDQVRAFGAALTANEVEHTLTIYPGVGHAFVKSDTYAAGGAATRAWKQMLDFLRRTIG